MATAEEQDAQFIEGDVQRRVAELERKLALLDQSGLDRLTQSGYLQFDTVPMRWDTHGMQVQAGDSGAVAAIYFVRQLVANPLNETQFATLSGYISGTGTSTTIANEVGSIDLSNTLSSTVYARTRGTTDGARAGLTASSSGASPFVELIQIGANTNGTFALNTCTLQLASFTSDPTTVADGDMWYRSDTDKLYARINGVTVDLGGTDAHIADTDDAHDASAISVLDTGGYYTGTDVEAVLAELGADGGSFKMTIPGLPFAFDPSELAGVGDVTVSSNTTYSTEAQRIQIADSFTISGANTLTAKQGLLVFCKTFTIDNASGVLTAAGSAGAAPVAQTGGVAGSDAGALASAGGTGGNGVLTANPGQAGGTPTALTASANVGDFAGMSQANELAWLAAGNYGTTVAATASLAGFPPASSFGVGGRGGGGGGGGGASGQNGGAGGAGGAATSFLNPTGGASGGGGVGTSNGSAGGAASISTFSAGWEQLFAMVLSAWYYGAGSGGGGGGSGGNSSGSGTSGAGGGGGAGGNPILIICDTFNNSGTILTSGGAGGNGGGATTSAAARGEGGGGGGGGAGTLIVLCRNLTNAGTLQAAAGANGAGSASQGGQNGGAGAAGTTPSFSAGYLLVRAG